MQQKDFYMNSKAATLVNINSTILSMNQNCTEQERKKFYAAAIQSAMVEGPGQGIEYADIVTLLAFGIKATEDRFNEIPLKDIACAVWIVISGCAKEFLFPKDKVFPLAVKALDIKNLCGGIIAEISRITGKGQEPSQGESIK